MEGLDTFATVYLNEKIILQSDNMFHSHRIDVTKDVLGDGNDNLEIQFDSAFKKGRDLKAKYSKHDWLCWNGDPSRLAVRKAQYHWCVYQL
jgi:beta-mannosidase